MFKARHGSPLKFCVVGIKVSRSAHKRDVPVRHARLTKDIFGYFI